MSPMTRLVEPAGGAAARAQRTGSVVGDVERDGAEVTGAGACEVVGTLGCDGVGKRRDEGLRRVTLACPPLPVHAAMPSRTRSESAARGPLRITSLVGRGGAPRAQLARWTRPERPFRPRPSSG